MTIKSKSVLKKRGIEIDLTGTQGNAFYLLGIAKKYAEQLGLDPVEISNEMKMGNYEDLIDVFEKYFGEYVTLYR
jgi:cytoskeletal protein RodZ